MRTTLLRRLLRMARSGYDFLQDWGMYWTLYPETTGDYEEDMKQLTREVQHGLATREIGTTD